MVFFLKMMILQDYVKKNKITFFTIIFFLFLTQGFMGWYMVKSGLVGRIDVSQYRLAMHLTMAFVILGITFQTLLDSNMKYIGNKKFYYKSGNEFLFLLFKILL